MMGVHARERLILNGCSTTKERLEYTSKIQKDAFQALNVAKVCCESFQEIEFKKIKIPSDNTFSIDRMSQVFEFKKNEKFKAGKSFIEAVELPSAPNDKKIVLKIFSQMYGAANKGHLGFNVIFDPSLMFLDEKFKPIVVLSDLNLTSYKEGFFETKFGMFSSIDITKIYPFVKYMIIFAVKPYELDTYSYCSRSGYIFMGGGAPIPVYDNSCVQIPLSTEGLVKISLMYKAANKTDDEDE